ncbi:MAG: GNAT family N-acetyltransferase [Acidobacteriota bacterium]|nr:GNAT family N-acetyltransferase [Acidobacteriota bacterium]
MEADPSPAFSIEPLHDRHDRAAFASGVAELDRYLHTQARQDAKRSVAAPFVLLEQGSAVIGYYTLSASGIRLTDLSAEAAKKLPKYPVLPATLLGRLAISEKRQGQKLGQFLLMDALRRSMENTREIGSIGVLVDAYDDSAEKFYLHHEFLPLPGQKRKLFLAMATIRKLFAA